MNHTHASTTAALLERKKHNQEQLGLIDTALNALSSERDGIVYEAHIQASMPSNKPIMAECGKLSIACIKARELWTAYHFAKLECSREIEIFARANGVRIAIMPEDAAAIIQDEGHTRITANSFTLDQRIIRSPNPMVFCKMDADFPSSWYATSPTPEPLTRTVHV